MNGELDSRSRVTWVAIGLGLRFGSRQFPGSLGVSFQAPGRFLTFTYSSILYPTLSLTSLYNTAAALLTLCPFQFVCFGLVAPFFSSSASDSCPLPSGSHTLVTLIEVLRSPYLSPLSLLKSSGRCLAHSKPLRYVLNGAPFMRQPLVSFLSSEHLSRVIQQTQDLANLKVLCVCHEREQEINVLSGVVSTALLVFQSTRSYVTVACYLRDALDDLRVMMHKWPACDAGVLLHDHPPAERIKVAG